jgi:putative addiction module killer protein
MDGGGTSSRRRRKRLDICSHAATIGVAMELRKTDQYDRWLRDLRDRQARARINARIRRLLDGNPGQHRLLTGTVVEMKIDYGPGYRVYYTERGGFLIVLLCGGDKSTQQTDIEQALRLAHNL